MVQLNNISLDLNSKPLFTDISCVIAPGDKIGLIGRNGAGKSTLLKIIAGIIKPSDGQLSIAKNTRIAYLAQEDVLNSPLSVFDEAFCAFTNIVTTENKIKEIEVAIENQMVTEQMLEQYNILLAESRSLQRHEAVKKTNNVLTGLGFTQAMIQTAVSKLSTGWKMRLALAKLLLTEADLYLFDEPTNHLDIITQHWLLEQLKSMETGFLLVSHDRAFLDKACNKILEIERGTGNYYNGNLTAYLTAKENQAEIAQSTRARQDREIAAKQKVVDRFRAGTRSQQAKNIQRQIERIELVEVESPLPTIKFHFPAPTRPGSVILKFHNLAHAFGEKMIFQSANGEIKRGQRVALVAANGVGKTTLINCIVGKYKPLRGTVEFGHNVHMAYFEQDQAAALDTKKTVLQEVLDSCTTSTEAEIRNLLGSFQFSGDDIYKKIGVLSGGEKNRVAMIKVLLQRANFLILDEPTNHLDLYAKDVLRQALAGYQGTILFVSHDADFVSKLATDIMELTPNGSFIFPGNYEDYCSAQAKTQTEAKYKSKKSEKAGNPQLGIPSKEAELIRLIDKLEAEEKKQIEALGEHAYGTIGYDKALIKLEATQKKLAVAQLEWEALTCA